MLDDIYILHDYVKTVNDKILDIDTSRVIRRIVTLCDSFVIEKITHRKKLRENWQSDR